MSRTVRVYRKIPIELKLKIVQLRLSGERSLRSISAQYRLSQENIIKWTRRYLAGLPLEKKRGKKSQAPTDTSSKVNEDEFEKLKKENEFLGAALAYKDEVLKYLSEKEALKKNKNS